MEKDKGALHFLEKLKIAENRRFKIVRGSIFDYHEKAYFDIVLALNIFHHFLKTEETYYQLIKLLKRLNMRVMFFQPPLPDDPRFKGSYHIFECNEFVEFILDNSCLNEAVRIGHTQDGRPVYRLRAM